MKFKNLFNVECVMLNAFLLYTLHLTLYVSPAETLTATPSKELINNSKEYDGKIVSYQGEIVGDVMRRGNFVWINSFDGENAIGIWLKKETLPEIKFTGDYRRRGDLVEIEGTFHANCLEHGGDLDVHGEKIKIIEAGYDTPEKINPARRTLAKNLTALTALLFICVALREVWNRWKKK